MPKLQASQDLPWLAIHACTQQTHHFSWMDRWMKFCPLAGQLRPPIVWLIHLPSVLTGPAELVSHLSSGCSSLLPSNQAPLQLLSLTSCCLKYTSSIMVCVETLIFHNILLSEGLTNYAVQGWPQTLGPSHSPVSVSQIPGTTALSPISHFILKL